MVDDPVPPTPRRRGHRRRKGPKPWFVLKWSIALGVTIIAYAGYVYIGRLCIPMIKRERNSLGSRRLGSESQRLPRTSLCLSLFVIFWYCGGGFILTTFLSFILVSVIFLAVFVVLGMMMIWSYIKVRAQFSVAPPCRSPIPPSCPLYPNARRVCSCVISCLGLVGNWVQVLFTPPGYAKVSLVPAVCRVLCSLSIRRFRICCVS